MKLPDIFVKEYKKFLIHKNATGEKVPNLEEQVADFNVAVEYANSVLSERSISDLSSKELLILLTQIHLKACPNLYKILPVNTKVPESPGTFRHDMTLELKYYKESKHYYTGIQSEYVFGMARFLREHHSIHELDIGLEFLSGYYKILWAMDFDTEQHNVFKRRVTMDYLTKNLSQLEANSFMLMYGKLAKLPKEKQPEQWRNVYSKISEKLDAPPTETEKSALEKIFWIRDCKDLEERTLIFASDLIEAVKKKSDPIEVFARFSYRFIQIHPFVNGNSRVMHIVLNAALIELDSTFIFLGNIFPTREVLYQSYFHQTDENSILPSFINTLRQVVALKKNEELLYEKTKQESIEWKMYPKDKLSGPYIGHYLLYYTFKSNNQENANRLASNLKADGFNAESRKGDVKRNPSILVDLGVTPF